MAGSQLSLLLTILLFIASSISVVSGQSTGVSLSLGGRTYRSNNSYVVITDIGVVDDALLCVTDLLQCCNRDTGGEWVFPNGSLVGVEGYGDSFYRNRGPGVVRLNRRYDATSPTGQYCCVVLDASLTTQWFCANVVIEIPTTLEPPATIAPRATTAPPPPSITMVSITSSGTATAGESHSLECSITVTGSTATPTITWLDDGVEISSTDPSRMVSMTTGSASGYSSTLIFNPLAASHAGRYTCRATLANAMNMASFDVTVQNPTIIVSIASSVVTPMVGSVHSLTCSVTGAERLTGAMVTYQWLKNGMMVSGQTVETFSFPSLTFSDAGNYTCRATVMSNLLSASITTALSNSLDVRLTLHNPTSVVVTSSILTPIRPIGSAVTLTCTVELSPLVDVPVTVTTVWTGPAGFMSTNTAQPVMGSTTTYTSTVMVRSFGREQSGDYTCRAKLSSMSLYLGDSSSLAGTAAYTVGTGVLNNTVKISIGVVVEVTFQFISNEDSVDINFSLACNSSGEPANSVVWTRDGFLLHNTGPLVLTDDSTFSYTNVLMVSGRTPGTYTCQIRGTNDQIVGSADKTVQASALPVNVRVTQSSSSALVEVSWSLPSNGAATITGYRIFYGSGQNVLVPSYVTRIIFHFLESPSDVGPTVSIRSESMQLPSELINATVTIEASHTCSSEVGIAVGALILTEGLIAVVIAIIVVLCWWIMRKRKSAKNDFAVSVNLAYGQMKLGAEGEGGGEYEDPDRLTRTGRGQGNPAPYEYPVSKPKASVYATADETSAGKTKST